MSKGPSQILSGDSRKISSGGGVGESGGWWTMACVMMPWCCDVGELSAEEEGRGGRHLDKMVGLGGDDEPPDNLPT